MHREHGGDIDTAITRFGGRAEDWVDLSTGINRLGYAVPSLPPDVWQALPTNAQLAGALDTAGRAYGTACTGVALSGVQAAIQILPHVLPRGRVAVLSPTYNEHAASFRAAAWQVDEVTEVSGLANADVAVVVNPNNPTGRVLSKTTLADLADQVRLLIVDESFADTDPECSLLPAIPGNTVVLRSLGKFFGLAGLRLGFAYGDDTLMQQIAQRAGPWSVSGPALVVGARALSDMDWQARARQRLEVDAPRLDALSRSAGWKALGGTPLFRLYDVGDGVAVQDALAQCSVWSRRFEAQPRWLRLGLPGHAEEWAKTADAIARAGYPAAAHAR